MKRNSWFKAGLGAGAVALIAAAGLATASPTLAQGITSTNPVTAVVQALGQRGGPGFGRGGMDFATIAKALNMTETDLRTELQAGKSVADVASAKGVSLDTIVNAIVAAQTETLKQAVTDGKMTQAQADTMLANLKATLPGQLQVKQIAGQGPKGDPSQAPANRVNESAIIAKALGITEDELRTEMQAGKSVSDVASAKGVSLTTIQDAIVAAKTDELKQAVTDGRLTQAQADTELANLKANLPLLLQLKGGAGGRGFGGPGGPGGGRGPGGPGGGPGGGGGGGRGHGGPGGFPGGAPNDPNAAPGTAPSQTPNSTPTA